MINKLWLSYVWGYAHFVVMNVVKRLHYVAPKETIDVFLTLSMLQQHLKRFHNLDDVFQSIYFISIVSIYIYIGRVYKWEKTFITIPSYPVIVFLLIFTVLQTTMHGISKRVSKTHSWELGKIYAYKTEWIIDNSYALGEDECYYELRCE